MPLSISTRIMDKEILEVPFSSEYLLKAVC